MPLALSADTVATLRDRISPILCRRIDDLDGCDGSWVLIRDDEPENGWDWEHHREPWRHLETCLEDRWRHCSLGFMPSLIAYSDYCTTGLVGKANYVVFTDPASTPDPHNAILTVGYGWNGEGVCLDVRFATDDHIETIRALSDYCLISDEEHSRLEVEAWEESWRDCYSREWRDAIERLLDDHAPEDAGYGWADDVLEAIPDVDAKLERLFEACREAANVYPVIEDLSSGAYVDLRRVLEFVDVADLRDLTGILFRSDSVKPEA